MTIQQVVQELRSHSQTRGKCYAGIMERSAFFVTLGRIERNEDVKPSTIKAFFNRFGYYGSYNEWTATFSQPLTAPKHLVQISAYH